MSALRPFLTNIANAIREKKETNAPINARDFASEILSIEGGSAVTDTPLTITSNGTTEAPDGVRYTPITVAVPKPTLNAPKIYLNPNGGYVRIKDVDNGNFSKEYILYLNSERATVFTTTKIKMQDYGITENDEIGVVAVSDMFNNSPMATTRWSDLELGTIGLTYSGNKWSGFGTSTDTEIYVASIVNEQVITGIGAQSLRGREAEQLTVYLPDSIKAIEKWTFYATENKHFVFGAYVETIAEQAFAYCTNCVFDLRNIDGVVTAKTNAFSSIGSNVYFLVEDRWYDDYVSATNWAGIANRIKKESVWEDTV